jgi:chemotaxis protein CheD
MIHIALPNKSIYSTTSKEGYFANMGLPLFLKRLNINYKCSKNELDIKIYGGSNSINPNDVFNIGNLNLLSVKGILDEMGIKYKLVSTGGRVSRTIKMAVSNGEVKLFELPIKI